MKGRAELGEVRCAVRWVRVKGMTCGDLSSIMVDMMEMMGMRYVSLVSYIELVNRCLNSECGG
jgi:hypothetical protein